jgi:hypothetical protein
MNQQLFEAADAYSAKFGDCPTIMCLPGDRDDIATKTLLDAVAANKPITDDEFHVAIGLNPIPPDVDV